MFQHGFILTDRIAVSSRHIDISCRHGGPSLGRGKELNASVVRCLWPTRYQDHGRMRCAILSGQWGDICWQRLARASPGLAQVRLNQQGLGQRANWAFRNPSPWSFWKVSWPTNPASIQPLFPGIRPRCARLARPSTLEPKVPEGGTAVWRIHFCIHSRPQYRACFVGDSRIPRQGSTCTAAAAMLARYSNRRFRGNEMAPDRTAAIGQVGFAAGSSVASNATRG